jgi:hypothetical protein
MEKINLDVVIIAIATIHGRENRLQKCLDAIKENTDFPHITSIYYDTELQGCVGPTRKMLSTFHPHNAVIVLNDDMIVQKNWLSILVSEYRAVFGNAIGLAQPNDTLKNGTLASCPFSCPAFLLEHWRPEYHHMYGDTELTHRVKYLKKYLYVPKSVVRHEHLSESKDPNYRHANKWWDIDTKTYNERKERNFDLPSIS